MTTPKTRVRKAAPAPSKPLPEATPEQKPDQAPKLEEKPATPAAPPVRLVDMYATSANKSILLANQLKGRAIQCGDIVFVLEAILQKNEKEIPRKEIEDLVKAVRGEAVNYHESALRAEGQAEGFAASSQILATAESQMAAARKSAETKPVEENTDGLFPD